MKKWTWLIIVGLVIGLAWYGVNYFSLLKPAYEPGQKQVVVTEEASEPVNTEPVPYQLEQVVNELFVPWSLIFPSSDRWLVSERNGAIRVVIDEILEPEPLYFFSEVSAQDEEGLMGLVLDPNYSENSFVYACLAYSDQGLYDKVVRLIDKGDQLVFDQLLLDRIPAARFHAGCRLSFGPDQKLYVSTGDATDREIAQDLTSLGGKILRLNSDGSIPEDNPWPNSPVFSYGHRNPQGLAWDPLSDQLWSTEHGPSVFDGPAGGDEVNLITAGSNYGWPLVSHEDNEPGLEAPMLVFTPAVAPGSAAFYTGQVFPQFSNKLFFGALKGEGVFVLDLNHDRNVITSFEKLEGIDVGRVRDVVTGPEGYVYFTSSNLDGRGDVQAGDDAIYRLVPQE